MYDLIVLASVYMFGLCLSLIIMNKALVWLDDKLDKMES
jgi:hypothetical protein